MTSPELISFIRRQKELGTPEPDYRTALLSQGWKLQDIDEALSALSSPSQINNTPLENPKKFNLLIWTEIILLILLVVGFFTGSRAGHASSLSDLISFAGIILIIPGFIIAVIGLKDAIVSFKSNIGRGILILSLSLCLLAISWASGAQLYRALKLFI